MGLIEQLEDDQSNMPQVVKHPFWLSKRMTYTICAFFCMIFHHTLRIAPSTSILCMVRLKEPNISSYQGDLDWTRNEAIWYNSYFIIGYVIALSFSGILADRYGGKAFFIGSMLVESFIFIVIPICAKTSYALAVVMRVISGLAAGIGTPAIYEMFTEWTHPSERTACIAFGYMGFNIANIVAPVLTTYICNTFGWEWVFYGNGGVIFLIAFGMIWLIYNGIDDHPNISQREYQYLTATKKKRSKKLRIPWTNIFNCVPYYVFIITHFLHSFGAFLEVYMLPRFFKEAMNVKFQDVGYYTTTVYCGALVTKVLVVVFSFKIEKKSINLDLYRRILHCSCCFFTVPFLTGSIFLTSEHQLIMVVLWTINVMITDVAFSAAYWPSLAFLAPSFAGLLVGIANCFGTISGIIVPASVAGLTPNATHAQWKGVTGLLIGVNVLEGIIFISFGSTNLQPWGIVKEVNENDK